MLGKFIVGDFIAIAGEMHRLQMKTLIITSALNPFSERFPNLYYSPIKKLENIFSAAVTKKRVDGHFFLSIPNPRPIYEISHYFRILSNGFVYFRG
jgi:hypothetical protein